MFSVRVNPEFTVKLFTLTMAAEPVVPIPKEALRSKMPSFPETQVVLGEPPDVVDQPAVPPPFSQFPVAGEDVVQ